jgi:membrane protein implicated in regulation of membrane protease activity
MKNPLRSEAEAYRFLWVTIVYFAAIVLASLAGNRWWGLGVFVLLTAAAAWRLLRRDDSAEPPPTLASHDSPAGERRIVVVANETVGGEKLRATIREKSESVNAKVLVVSPALNSPLKHWVSDEDGARRAAQERLDASIARLAEAGIAARGEVGDAEPLQALEDALRTFGGDEIIISTHPEGRSNWLEQGLVARARERFDIPITHVVVDLAAEDR